MPPTIPLITKTLSSSTSSSSSSSSSSTNSFILLSIFSVLLFRVATTTTTTTTSNGGVILPSVHALSFVINVPYSSSFSSVTARRNLSSLHGCNFLKDDERIKRRTRLTLPHCYGSCSRSSLPSSSCLFADIDNVSDVTTTTSSSSNILMIDFRSLFPYCDFTTEATQNVMNKIISNKSEKYEDAIIFIPGNTNYDIEEEEEEEKDATMLPSAFYVPLPNPKMKNKEEQEGGVTVVFTGHPFDENDYHFHKVAMHQIQHYFNSKENKDGSSCRTITLVTNDPKFEENKYEMKGMEVQTLTPKQYFSNAIPLSKKQHDVTNSDVLNGDGDNKDDYDNSNYSTIAKEEIHTIAKYIEAVHTLHHATIVRQRSTRLQRKLQKKVDEFKKNVNQLLVEKRIEKDETEKGDDSQIVQIENMMNAIASSASAATSDRMINNEEELSIMGMDQIENTVLYHQIQDARTKLQKEQAKHHPNEHNNSFKLNYKQEEKKRREYSAYMTLVRRFYQELSSEQLAQMKSIETTNTPTTSMKNDTESFAKNYARFVNANIDDILPKQETSQREVKKLSKPQRSIRLVVISDTHGYEMSLTPSSSSSSSSSSLPKKKKKNGTYKNSHGKRKEKKILDPWFPFAAKDDIDENYNIDNHDEMDDINVINNNDEEQYEQLLPPGDVLLHLGDFSIDKPPSSPKKKTKKSSSSSSKKTKSKVCPQRRAHSKFDSWLSKQPHAHKFVLRGNHDPINVVFPKSNATYISTKSELVDVHGWILRLIPYARYNKLAMLGGSSGGESGSSMTDPCHVLATHEPPRGYLDKTILGNRERVGSVTLLRYIRDDMKHVDKPMFWFCGHIHEGRGFIQTSFEERGKAKQHRKQGGGGDTIIERERLFLSSPSLSLERKKSVVKRKSGAVSQPPKPIAITKDKRATGIFSTALSSSSVDDDDYETKEEHHEGNNKKEMNIKNGNKVNRQTTLINASNANPGPARCLNHGPVIIDLLHDEYDYVGE